MDRKYKSSLIADYSQIHVATKHLKGLKTPSRKFKTASRLSRNYFKSTSRSLQRQVQVSPQGNLFLLSFALLDSRLVLFVFNYVH